MTMDSLVQREIVRSPGLDADAGLRTHGAEQANLRRGFGRRRATIAALERIIHVDVVPRLVTARRTALTNQQWDWGTEGNTKAQQVAELTHALLTDGNSAAYDYVDAVRTRGSTLERIYLELITPTARHLGELWVEDMCGFTDVTVGLWRLQRIVREMSPLFQLDALRGWSQDQILLAPMPGEQHTFGLYLVAEFFRRDGWNVTSMPVQKADELVALVRSEWFTLIGLSLACSSRLDELAAEIQVIRRCSCNPGIAVMVGGAAFIDHPERTRMVGADVTAVDAKRAPMEAHDLVTSMTAN